MESLNSAQQRAVAWRMGGIQRATALVATSVLFVAGLLAGCGSSGAPASAPTTQANSSGGAQGGQVVVYTAEPNDLADRLAKDFEQQTGIHVTMFQSTTGKIMGRLEAERSHPQADVVVLADWSAAETLKQEGVTQPFHPDHADQLIWQDPENHYVAYSASALGITYNTKMVAHPPQHWVDVLQPEYRNKVVMPDPSSSGSALDFVGGYLQNHGNSLKFFQELKANGGLIQGANADTLNQVVSGAKSVVLAGVDYAAYAAKAKGEPIDITYPQDGTVVNPRPVVILKSAKNLANAEKFVNFLLSDQGQAEVAKSYLLPGRKDVPGNPGRPSLNELHPWTVDWKTLEKNKKQIIQEVVNLRG